MKTTTCIVVSLALLLTVNSLSAGETSQKIPDPGFRPECDLAPQFIAQFKNATLRIYPTIIRTPTNTVFSTESQQQVVEFLGKKAAIQAESDKTTLDPGEIVGRGQFDWFQHDMQVIGEKVKEQKVAEDYVIVMEVLFPPMRGNRQEVFGIHCIVLNAAGENAFSFLLNSHHKMFVDAHMVADDQSAESRAQLVGKATEVGLEALMAQINHAEPPPMPAKTM